jgi:transposase InsO family protein
MVSNSGPQFVSAKMKRFLQLLSIQHVKSRPHYPQSNEMVERLHHLIRERLQGLRPAILRLQQILMDV